jgi:putative oxidoreductase
MRDAALLGLRLTVGGYLAAHGAQKLFGSLDGPGLDKAGAGFERIGLQPGKAFATLAGAAEFAGGLLTAAGVAEPVGPVAIAGAMAVASLTHADKGPMMQKGGFELPAAYLASALALAAHGPGRYSLEHVTGIRLPRSLAKLTIAGAAALTAYSAAQVVRSKRAARAAVAAPATPAPAATDAATEPAVASA